MAKPEAAEFLSGVIEGFYGPPWTQAERLELFDWMADWGLNTYLYALKDDLKHRARWRELYSDAEAAALQELIGVATARGIRFIYALGPGLDIRYSSQADLDRLKARFQQLMALGCRSFALLFDDIPDRMDAEDLRQWGSLAAAQSAVANAMFHWAQAEAAGGRFLFCPTPYCGRMAEREHGGKGYLETIGREMASEIDIFWTGREIISREITLPHVQELQKLLRRKPLIWDNLHANDYDGRRFYCGPYSGRAPELRHETSGLLANPNNEFSLNFVPLRTLAKFVHGEGAWDARQAYLSAMQEWLPRFSGSKTPITLDALIQFGDCYYLPHEEGLEAERLLADARAALAENPAGRATVAFRQQSARLREFCAQAAEIFHRPLFYALSRRIWELREEMDLLEKCLAIKEAKGPDAAWQSDFHLPGTYRGGIAVRLQQLLQPQPDGSFTLAPPKAEASPAPCLIRAARPGDAAAACHVCLKTGDFGKDGEPFYRDDPDALGRIFVEPYLAFEPEFSLMLEDEQGVSGYVFGALDSRRFYHRYETEWRPGLCARFPAPQGDQSQWTRAQMVHHWYHHPDYFCPEPYAAYPSHLHIDLLARAQGRGYGRQMLEQVMEKLRQRGSPGAHLGVSMANIPAIGFYQRLGFKELARVGSGTDGCIYMGKPL